jgi:diaminohydroxyphosphoribosylaminopyrimidine deaminase/5-amino-6-(5-phosphoribosylamino)uracil reductase
VPARAGHVDLRKVLRELGTRKILHVLLEAGAELNGAALKSDIVDKVALFYAPKFMGTGGVPAVGIPSRWFAKSPALKSFRIDRCEPDFLVEGYFHDVYGNHGIRRKD